jgi:hypothetical protein
VGAGKTRWAIEEDLIYTQVLAPRQNGLIVVPDYGTFGDVIIPEIEQHWPRDIWRVAYPLNRPELRVQTPEGLVKIFVRSGQNRRVVRAIAGLQVSWAHFEEGGRIFEGAMAWDLAMERLRGKSIIYNGTRIHGPIHLSGSPWPGWLPELFECEEGHPPDALVTGYSPKPGYWIRQAKTEDNNTLAPEFAERMRAKFGPDWAAQEIDGQITQFALRILHNFFVSIHVIPHEEAMKKYAMVREGRREGGVDFGSTDPASLVYGGWLAGHQAVVIGEWYRSGQNHEDQGYEAWKIAREYGTDRWYCPHDQPQAVNKWRRGFHRARDGKTYRVDGVVDADTRGGSRAAGFSTIRNLLAIKANEEPGLYISDKCVNLIREMRRLRRPDKNEAGRSPKEGETDPRDDDHAVDAMRYWLHTSISAARHRTSYVRGLR